MRVCPGSGQTGGLGGLPITLRGGVQGHWAVQHSHSLQLLSSGSWVSFGLLYLV